MQRVLVDYLELSREEGAFTLILEHDQLVLADDQGSGLCVERNLAPLVMRSLFAEHDRPRLVLVAEDEAELGELKAMLPEAILAEDAQAETSTVNLDEDGADEYDLDAPAKPVNTRVSEEIGGFGTTYWCKPNLPLISARSTCAQVTPLHNGLKNGVSRLLQLWWRLV